jgi:predicted small integral membrane protein
LRLKPAFRFALYAAFAILLITGAAWIAADRWKESSDLWQEIAANLLMLHGGAAMAALMLLGALAPLHMQRGWRAARNRIAGAAMVTFNAALIVTAFGLYYAGSEMLRPWMSDVHIGVGLALPIMFLIHVVLGKRSI